MANRGHSSERDASFVSLLCRANSKHEPIGGSVAAVADAVREWLESREDAELLPAVEAARTEWKEKGGRPWTEAERELEESVEHREGATEAKRV